MNGLIMAIQLLAGLSILVILHELGHFLVARAFGIKVEKFYLFFDAWGFKLFSFKRGDCEYGIGWLPLGGYVKIAGAIDESMDTNHLKQSVQSWEYRSKPPWQRLIVMMGGIVMNMLVGVCIFWMLAFFYGESTLSNKDLQHGIVAGTIAQEIGFQSGDKIIAINGKSPVLFNEIKGSEVLLGGATITINRNGAEKIIVIPVDFMNKLDDGMRNGDAFIQPRTSFFVDTVMPDQPAAKAGLKKGDRFVAINDVSVPYFDLFQSTLQQVKGKVVVLKILRNGCLEELKTTITDDGKLGFHPAFDLPYVHQQYGFFDSFPPALQKGWSTISTNAQGIAKIVKGEIRADKALSGPIGMATVYGSVFEWQRFWTLTAIISLALALMNLLPIPALDGGHVLFLLVEIIKGKPLSDKFLEKAQLLGFVLLLGLMIFAFGNDILRLVT